jgi:hypothetical protein
MSTNYYDVLTRKENGDKSFQSDCRKAYVISKSYGMGDPLAPSEAEENSGGGRLHPSATV